MQVAGKNAILYKLKLMEIFKNALAFSTILKAGQMGRDPIF